ncbi:MAG: trypsin-like serine protease [Bdellovibrio sp.]|nr:trypsin-like serine protease [Bdellovibrio sp.]
MNKLIIIFISIVLFSCFPGTNSQLRLKLDHDHSIIGGTEVSSESPISRFTVGLYDKKTHFICTGSLIRENLIVTAAHCIESDAKNIVIIFGLDFSAYDSNNLKSLRTATSVQVHPDFKKEPTSDLDWNDIALVQFSGGLPDGFSPVKILKDSNLLQAGTSVQMAGYGASGAQLEEVTLKKGKKFQQALDAGEIVCYDKSLSHCYEITFSGTDRLRSTEAKIEGFTEKEIRMNESRGHGTCVGDSGGPLIYQHEGIAYLIGLTSRGSQFCDGPAIYTNALEYIEWINRQ